MSSLNALQRAGRLDAVGALHDVIAVLVLVGALVEDLAATDEAARVVLEVRDYRGFVEPGVAEAPRYRAASRAAMNTASRSA